MQIGFKHSTKEWDQYITQVREKFPEKVETLVSQTTTSLSRQVKASVPTKYSGIRSSIKSRVKPYIGKVRIKAHYAPYIEFGTGRFVQVPTELKDYAMQFKGRGIREVNIEGSPYFYPQFFLARDKFFKQVEKALKQL